MPNLEFPLISRKIKYATKTPRHQGYTKIIKQIISTLCVLVSWRLGGRKYFSDKAQA